MRSSLKHGRVEIRHRRRVCPMPASQQLHTCFCDQERVLKLRGPSAIRGHSSPIVWPRLVSTVRTKIDHGLHSEDVPRLHYAHCFVLPVVRNLRRTMKELADSVPTVRCDNSTAVLRSLSMNDVAELSVE